MRLALAKERLSRFHWMATFETYAALRYAWRRCHASGRVLRLPWGCSGGGSAKACAPHVTINELYRVSEHVTKPVFTIVRNPFDQLVSICYHSLYRHPACRPKEVIRLRLSKSPDRGFADFLRYNDNCRLNGLLSKHGISRNELNMDVGFLTCRYVLMWFKNPAHTLRTMDRDYFTSGRCKKDMPEFTFMRFENLSDDLYHELLNSGMASQYIDFLRRTPRKMNASRHRKRRHWREYYDNDLMEYVLTKEWPLFHMFPDYSVP